MPSYHCSVKSGGKGRAGKHSDYISREGKYAPELTKGSGSKLEDLEHTASGNMPEWSAHDPGIFWRAADEHERANGATYREIEVALPRELNPAQRRELVEDFIQQHIGDRHPYTYAIHKPKAAIEKGEQPHAHIMYSERTLDGIARDPDLFFKRANTKAPEKGGCKKASGGKSQSERKSELLGIRERWADVQNRHLERAGIAERVTHLSLKEQGIERTPEIHLGPVLAREHAPALREHRAAERELAQTPQVDATAELAAQAQAQAAREAAQAQAAQQAREAAEAQQQADREARRQAAREAAEINSKLTAEKEEKENDRIRKSALAALAKASGATDSAIAVAVTDHASIGRDVQTAKGSVLAARDANRASNVIAANHGPSFGSAAKRAERREFRKHLESGTPAVAKQLRPINRVVQQLVEFLPAVISTIAAAAKAVTQHAQALEAAEQARRQAQAQQQARQEAEAEARARQEAKEAREARRQAAEAEAQQARAAAEAAAQAQQARAAAEAKKKAINTKLTVAPLVDSPFDKAGLHRSDDLELVRRAQELFSQPQPDGYARYMLSRDISSAMGAAVREIRDTEPRHAASDAERTIKEQQNADARRAGQPDPWKAEQTACAWDTIAFRLERERREHLDTKRPSGFFSGSAAKEYDAKTDSLTSQIDNIARATAALKADLQAKLAAQAQQAAQRDPQRHADAKERHEGLMLLHKAVGAASREIEAEQQRDIDHGNDFGL